MYRIEVSPGEESVFRTIEELAVGIRNGVITSRARIYHHASQKWLPIGLHPHYKKALEMPAAKAMHPPGKTPPTLSVAPRTTARPTPRSEPRTAAAPGPSPRARPASVVEPRTAPEPGRTIPPPVPSPIIAMQQEVLRDLPVVAIPDPRPLPWGKPAPRDAAPAPARPVIEASPPSIAAPREHPASTAAQHAAPPVLEQRHVAPVAKPWSAPRVDQEREPSVEPQGAGPEGDATPRPTARRSRRGNGRPMLLIGVAAALVMGAHFALTAAQRSAGGSEPAARGDAAEPSAPGDAAEQTVRPANRSRPAEHVTSAPARLPSAPLGTASEPARVPMVPGPAFAGSAPARRGAASSDVPRAMVGPASPATAPATTDAPAGTEATASPAIAPAPAALELALPLPPDSIVPSHRAGDTLAMKKILRALNGTKP